MHMTLLLAATSAVLSLRLSLVSPAPSHPRCAAPLASDASADPDLNLLQTRLYHAVATEDYEAAAAYRDRIAARLGQGWQQGRDWRSYRVPEWLCDRLERMGFQLPTRVQMHALEAMGKEGRDAAICAATGSGKTLAYLVPALTRLSAELMQARSACSREK